VAVSSVIDGGRKLVEVEVEVHIFVKCDQKNLFPVPAIDQ
jgi:hypothetical protein